MVIYMLVLSFTQKIKLDLGDDRVIETFFISLIRIIFCMVL